jgi:pimeloyl-ACP methyl ester carboxylesterase
MDSSEPTVVLVGHSWGGAVITQGADSKVKALVFGGALLGPWNVWPHQPEGIPCSSSASRQR